MAHCLLALVSSSILCLVMCIESMKTNTISMIHNMKRITFVRHGTTEMNEQIDRWGSQGFRDKMLFDTKLSPRGLNQCKTLHESIVKRRKFDKVSQNDPIQNIFDADLIVASPLYRTLQTAEYSLASVLSNSDTSKKVVLPLAAETLFLSSDVGIPKSQLQELFQANAD